MVLVRDSAAIFRKRYEERVLDCIGELPPFDTIWKLGDAAACRLDEDLSDAAIEYGFEYTTIVMSKLREERDC